MRAFKLCDQRKALLESDGHLLVLGGPGSGKTTIALVKAGTDIRNSTLADGQRVLFLSFARATIARIIQESKFWISQEYRPQLEVNTYHGFAWEFIRSFGYLLTGHRTLRLLTPPDAAGRLAGVTKEDRPVILRRMLAAEANLGFDLFAEVAADLLEQSSRLCCLISDCYPTIVLDEFQDTNRDEWRMIAALGRHCRLIALADAEQRIYEFRGADPARIGEFIGTFKPTIIDFGKENNRSDGTDITDFGNDLLTGANVGKSYQQVKVVTYGYDAGEQLSSIKYQTLAAMRRLINNGGQDWSLAILVKSKDVMLKVSLYLNTASARLPAIQHDVLIDPEGPALAAVLLSGLLEGAADADSQAKSLLSDVVNHMRGRQGGTISQADLGLAEALSNYLGGASLRGKNRLALIADIGMIAERRLELQLSGDPEADWIAVRDLVDAAQHPKLKAISEDARFIRLLNRGAVLRETLGERWRISESYSGARRMVADALLQEHFSAATRVWTGVNVMTVHKAKGKEFDEVIVFEGAHSGRLLRENPTERDTEQARLVLRVAVTRARTRTALLTPNWKRCPLL